MKRPRKYTTRIIGLSLLAALGTALAVALLVDIFEKKQTARQTYVPVATLTEETDDPAEWGKNFPFQYESYLKTVDQTRTRFGGSEALPRTPTQADPRATVAQSRLEEDPRLKTMWAGYAFSKDFREERGHAYMFIDQVFTERQKVTKQPGTCLNCHASTWVAMRKLGNGDVNAGFEKLNQLPYDEAKKHVTHPVSCLDCHAPQTIALRVTRPAFIEGIRLVKEREGVKNYDVNKMASHQEMRAFVCSQCHVEYYFKGPEKRLTFPWSNGLKADEIFAYYEKNGHKDWVHEKTGAPALKAQHPEFELWSQGIHARSGVACVDCHMPYKRVGAAKVSDHQVRSPMLNIGASCRTCHHWPEAELKARVEQIQERTFELRNVAMNALTDLIGDLEAETRGGRITPGIEKARRLQRRAQFLLDFIEAENSTGFHAPQEAGRVLGLSIDASRQGQAALRRR
jgi:nitrite reductase (cytochrome c-552)